MLGDVKSLEQEIDEYIKRVNEQDREIEKLENSIDTTKLDSKDRQKISEAKEKIDYAKYKGDKVKQGVCEFKRKIGNSSSIQSITKLQFELQKLVENVDNLSKFLLDRAIEIGGILSGMDESVALWKLSSDKFTDGVDYIDKNGKFVNKIDDIKNEKVRDFVRNKVCEQMNTKNSRGIILFSDSSLAQKISNSNTMKQYIHDNKEKFKPYTTLKDTSLDFNILNPDMFNALHKTDIIDIKIEKDGTFTAKVIDTYDFNKNSKNPLVRIAGHYQEKGKIENYYTITIIKIPESVWRKY